MRRIVLGTGLALVLQACGALTSESGPEAACKAEVRKALLNPETAEFRDFSEIDADQFIDAVLPALTVEYSTFPFGVDVQSKWARDSAHLYRMRVRAEGKLGNTITKFAYCSQRFDFNDDCECRMVD